MPIPFLLIAGIGAAALGVGKSIKAGVDQHDANDTNDVAQRIIDRSTKAMNTSREESGHALAALGQAKLDILEKDIKSFVAAFEQLHNVNLKDSQGLQEIDKFHTDVQAISKLKEMQMKASSVAGGLAGGAAAGALTAIGAYGATMTFAAASTGTAIATLSGAAATNATLAFLGGGSLAAGGLGIAGGTAVLGGLIAGPALAIMGFVVGAKASANRDAAYENLAKAREYEEEIVTARVACKGIRMRATMFKRLLLKLDTVFAPLISRLEEIIKTSGTDYSAFTEEEQNVVAASMTMAKAIKSVLDTPILNEDSNLTPESLTTAENINAIFESDESEDE